jgi:hypothetical protein
MDEHDMNSHSRRDLSLSMGKAYLYVAIFVVPIFIGLCGIYLWLWGIENTLGGFMRLTQWSIFIPILVLGVLLHEFIHGMTWALLSKRSLGEIKFGFQLKTLTPYAHCKKPMYAREYRLGAIMPFLLMGVLPYIIALSIGNGWLASFGLVFVLAAGGDIVVLWSIRRVKGESLVEDHPSRAGCYVCDNGEW